MEPIALCVHPSSGCINMHVYGHTPANVPFTPAKHNFFVNKKENVI